MLSKSGLRWHFDPLRPLTLIGLLAAGCSQAAEPQWVRLAQIGTPGDPTPLVATAEGGIERLPTEGGWWLRVPIRPDEWAPQKIANIYRAPTHVGTGYGLPPRGLPAHRFTLGGADVARIDLGEVSLGEQTNAESTDSESSDLLRSLRGVEGQGFAAFNDDLFLHSPGGPPSQLGHLDVFVPAGGISGDQWRTRIGEFSGDGWLLWEGAPMELTVDIPPRSSLSAWLAVRCGVSDGSRGATARLNVELDGQTWIDTELSSSGGLELAWQRAALPPEGREAAKLRFSITGTDGVAALFDPLIGPADIGRPGARPWKSARRDVVVFLADTFRADLLQTHGASEALAPFLDSLAERSLVYDEVWSPSSWTLPSHASIFSGLHPYEHGATANGKTLPQTIVTLAEQFQSREYRTAAVTDGLFVSQSHALDQGFAVFDEDHSDIDATLERTRRILAADDGRPLLLFVQSYSVHSPFGTPADFPEYLQLMRELQTATREHGPSSENNRAPLERLYELYRDGVPRLDDGVRDLVGELESRGLLTDGAFVFTSDHGEAFGEHDHFSHGTCVYEEVVHVPLFIHGPSVPPGRRTVPVSLVQLPTTLAELAGLPADRGWRGPSLLSDSVGPTYAFGCYAEQRGDDQAAVRVGPQKLILPVQDARSAGAAPTHAFELEADPTESRNRADSEWSRTLLQKQRGAVEERMSPKHRPGDAAIDAETNRRLGAMGYAGDEP